MFKKFISAILSFLLLLPQTLPAAAAELSWLPAPGVMVAPGAALRPPVLRGIRVNMKDPFRFQFLVEEGQQAFTDEEADRNLKYFFTALTVPEKEVWVNLSPLESGRIVPDVLADTAMGRDLLGQDYLLKQLSSSMLFPEQGIGKEFWQRVYARAAKEFGTTDIPLDVVSRVWITPGDIDVQERGGTAVIARATLQVMTEDDYLSREGKGSVVAPEKQLMTRVFREVVVPELEREVNSSEHFTAVRQVYNALILAAWYKRRFSDGTLSKEYVDRGKTAGISTGDKTMRAAIYERYLEAYKKGVFNFIREEADVSGDVLPRKYFSGGVDIGEQMASHLRIGPMGALPVSEGPLRVLDVGANSAQKPDASEKPESYITKDPRESGNKGLNLFKMEAILPGYVPPFEMLSARLYAAHKSSRSKKSFLAKVVKEVALLEHGGTFAIRPAGMINMPGVIPTVKGISSVEDIVGAIIKIYEAWESPEAVGYLKTSAARQDIGGRKVTGPAVVIQQEVFGDGDAQKSASGVFMSRDQDTGDFVLSGSLGLNTKPEDIRNGSNRVLHPLNAGVDQDFPLLGGDVHTQLVKISHILEKHYQYPVEVEFIIDRGRIYIVQVNRQDIPQSLEMAVFTKMADEQVIPRPRVALPKRTLVRQIGRIKPEAVFSEVAKSNAGLAPGAVDGRLAFSVKEAKKMRVQGNGPVIIVSDDPNQEGLLQLLVSGDIDGLMTTYGDYHMHLARIAREGLIPGISLVGQDVQVSGKGDGRALTIGGRRFTSGDRLAIAIENHIELQPDGQKEMVHTGVVVEPNPEHADPVVETRDVPMADLYFDVAKLQDEVRQKYGKRDPVVLAAAHALLKAYLHKNVVKGIEANKLEAATNAIHLIIGDQTGDTSPERSREEEFTPIINGFGSKYPFPDIRTVDDLEKVLEQMTYFVNRYKALKPAAIRYVNYENGKRTVSSFGQQLPIEFSIDFEREDVNWEYENPALWAFVRQARPRIDYQDETGMTRFLEGPWVEGVSFMVDVGDPSVEKRKIRVSGHADVLGGHAGRVFAISLLSGGRAVRTFNESYVVEARDFDGVVRHRAEQAVHSYRPGRSGDMTSTKMKEVLSSALAPFMSAGLSVVLNGRANFISDTGDDGRSSQPGAHYREGGFFWRWFDQSLGSYESDKADKKLKDPDLGWKRESAFFTRLLRDLFPDQKNGVFYHGGLLEQQGLELHNQNAMVGVSNVSWVVLSEGIVSSLADEVARLGKKYDLRDVIQDDDRGNKRVDLEGALILMYLERGGTVDGLVKLAGDASQQVGGIDLNISDRVIGNAEQRTLLQGRAADIGARDIAGLVPVILSQSAVPTMADFVDFSR
ncbi:MAG: hypothetical protein WCO69_05690 [Candidatus Omnitrophota bacterium]